MALTSALVEVVESAAMMDAAAAFVNVGCDLSSKATDFGTL
ncbi:MAG: hypothetical protein U0791_06805 [Gemmataceae bacterium]